MMLTDFMSVSVCFGCSETFLLLCLIHNYAFHVTAMVHFTLESRK